MTTVSRFILTKVLGWKITGNFPDINKSVVIFAPHTSYIDSVYGKLYLNQTGINHKFLSKKELFFFPMNYIMKWYGSIPIRGVKGENAIFMVTKLFESNANIHIIMSPEGHLARTSKWNKGFYYMAVKSNVPIVVGFMDYNKKEIGIKGVIYELDNDEKVMSEIALMYQNVGAKNPERFSLHLN